MLIFTKREGKFYSLEIKISYYKMHGSAVGEVVACDPERKKRVKIMD